MADQNCPSVEELSDFLVGKLPDEVYESIAEHVEQCAACQGTVPNLAVPDETFLSRFIGPAVENPLEEESACRRAVAAIERFGLDPIFSTEGANRNDAATGLIVRQIGPYDILEELGAGGMGAVYKALHTKLQKVVAVKVLPPESLKNPGAVARFEREMVAVGRLSHPHIVGATDAGESDGTHFLVMEYVDGCDLAALVRQHGPLGIPEACELVRQAAVGLQYAHEHGMVHRDVKPSNLILSTEGTVKILDLGLAVLEERLDESGSVTASGTVMGSLDYMAPEQAEDSHAVDIRSDVYSLGATLCTLLTGHPPYHGEKFRGVMQKLHALATLDPPVLEELHSRLPAELAQLIERMLAKNPADRPATPGEVAELLAPFAAGPRLETLVSGSRGERDGTASTASLIDGVSAAKTPTVITPPSPAPSECPPRRFTPKRVLLAALAAVLLLGAGIVFHIRTDQGELIVTSDDPDVEITVRRHGGDIVENIELSQGRGETKLRSGAYELIVKGADADSFIVRPDVVTLKRGEEVRATVTLKSTGTPAEAGEKPALAVKPATPAPPWQPTPEQQAFLDQVAGLPAEEQVQAVAKKLMEVNPGFDGSVQHRIEADNVISLAFATDQITDIWPVRALADLKRLFCDGSATRKGKLADLSPLAGMQLTDLTCGHTHVSDLSPLQGMPIRWLGLWTTPVTDLSPLAGMPLYHLQIEGTGVSDISPLRGMRIKRLSLSSTAVSDLSPLDGAPLTELSCHGTSITDLSPLAKAPLTVLHCAGTRVSDLSPLEGAPLTRLTVNRTRVSDLSPLAGMPLTYLNADETPIADLSPLKGMELTELYCAFTRVGDLTPLEGMPLRNFSCDEHPLRSNQGVIRKITSLETINGRPAAEILSSLSPVWQPTPEQQAFFDQVARLQAEEQVQTVAKKLMEVNPGFDGSVQHRIEADNVISLAFATDQITDIWPVRALADLRSLGFYGSGEGRGNGRLADLSPLAGMRLQQLECIKTPVSDLAPLAGMPLRVLRFNHTDVADLTPLAGMPLTSLHCYVTRVSDLAPVAGMPLANVDCSGTEISDLSPLAGTPLKYLNCSYTKVTDFSPLKGMPLTQLVCSGVPVSDIAPLAGLPLTSLSLYRAKVSDLAPLAGMELTAFSCDGAPVSDLSALENMPLKNLSCDEHQLRSNQGVIRKLASLKTINGQPAAEILSSLSPAWHPTPEQQAFFDQVAGLPAEEQVQAVTEKLMEVNPEFDGSGVWSRIEAKKVLEISFKTDHVTDIWPVRALADLTTLACRGSAGPDGTQRNGKLSDLSPLAGMALQRLYCTHNPQLSDLSPLAGMPLTTLECSYNRSLSDPSPLAGMPLTELALIVNPVSDLSPLRGMRLEALNCNGTRVSDLSPLHGMPLTSLSCGNTNVSDIAPLAGMPLTELHCGGTPISDLSPLKSQGFQHLPEFAKSLQLWKFPRLQGGNWPCQGRRCWTGSSKRTRWLS